MDQQALKDEIVDGFDGMSGQIRVAARYVLDSPSDVALLSMREQARRAGVKPATMTRLAKALGFSGYDDIREIHAETLRGGGAGFASKASARISEQRRKGDRALAAGIAGSVAGQVARLAEPDMLDRLVAAGRRLGDARRVFCLGLRASHPAAWHLGYVLGLIGDGAVHLDGAGGAGPDILARAGEGDALFVVSVRPYTRATIDLADAARAQGVAVVAVTDSLVAPLALAADEVVIVPTESPSFFHAMSPAFVVAEILAAIVAGRRGEAAVAGLRAADAHFAALGVHLDDRRKATAKPGAAS